MKPSIYFILISLIISLPACICGGGSTHKEAVAENPPFEKFMIIEFAPGKAEIQERNKVALDKIVNTLKEAKNKGVTIQGRADSTGSHARNKQLSARRAEAVKNYLVSKHAVEAGKVNCQGLGEDHPRASNATPAGRAKNRTVAIIIAPVGLAE